MQVEDDHTLLHQWVLPPIGGLRADLREFSAVVSEYAHVLTLGQCTKCDWINSPTGTDDKEVDDLSRRILHVGAWPNDLAIACDDGAELRRPQGVAGRICGRVTPDGACKLTQGLTVMRRCGGAGRWALCVRIVMTVYMVLV